MAFKQLTHVDEKQVAQNAAFISVPQISTPTNYASPFPPLLKPLPVNMSGIRNGPSKA